MSDLLSTIKDPRFMSVAIFAILFVSTATGIAVPYPIMPLTQLYYDTIEAVPQGGTIAFVWYTGSPSDEPYGPSLDTLIHLRMVMEKNDVRIVMWSTDAAREALGMDAILRVWTQEEVDALYGKNIARIGVMPPDRATRKLWAADMRSVFLTDYYQTPLDDLPMFDNVNSASDYDLICVMGTYSTEMMEDWVIPYGVQMLYTSTQTLVKAWYYVITAGHVKSALAGVVAGAEYERLLGITGLSAKYMFALSCMVVFGIAILIGTNINYFIKRAREAESAYDGRGTDRYFKEEAKE
jgi:hypothetical protein